MQFQVGFCVLCNNDLTFHDFEIINIVIFNSNVYREIDFFHQKRTFFMLSCHVCLHWFIGFSFMFIIPDYPILSERIYFCYCCRSNNFYNLQGLSFVAMKEMFCTCEPGLFM